MAKPPVKKKPPAKKASRAAKDLKPGDSRASYLKKAEYKKTINFKDIIPKELSKSGGPDISRPRSTTPRPNNPIGDFLKGETQKRKLPVVVEQPKNVRGNPNMAKPSSVIKQGYTPGSASRALVPYTAPVNSGGVVRSLARVATARATGAIGAIVDPNFMNYKSDYALAQQAAADKPPKYSYAPAKLVGDKLGNRKTVNPYTTSKKKKDIKQYNTTNAETRYGMKATLEGYRKSAASAKAAVARDSYFTDVPSYKGTKKSGSYFKDVPSYTGVKPSVSTANASEFKKKNLKANQEVGKKPKSTAKAPKAPSFKGNWTGATPTEMQKRGGQRIKRPNLLSLFRGKR
jgi:hypothetical protein